MSRVSKKRRKADSREALGMERYFDKKYAFAGGYARWVSTVKENKTIDEQAEIFGTTVQTIYNHRKWYEEWTSGAN
jgi:hypothetical protein